MLTYNSKATAPATAPPKTPAFKELALIAAAAPLDFLVEVDLSE